ncbi:MAG: PmoA family protein [Phycisphaeraceae bacterium]|nr:PmoA family protein [Phycisphaeraceae bacterium]
MPDLVHENGSVSLYDGDTELFRYGYRSSVDVTESPRPCFHPVRTRAGHPVTDYRPDDHPWHVGISMTCAELSGENFWGGPTWTRDRGYQRLENNGSQIHQQWETLESTDSGGRLAEQLQWVTRAGDHWLNEARQITATILGPDAWVLDLASELTNLTDRTLEFGSPTTAGRENAGYGGWCWRGPERFTRGDIRFAGGGEGETDAMGHAAPWIAITGPGTDGAAAATVIFIDHPDNPRYPTPWYARQKNFPAVSFAFSFHEIFPLEPGDTLALRHRIIIADGRWETKRIEEASKTR